MTLEDRLDDALPAPAPQLAPCSLPSFPERAESAAVEIKGVTKRFGAVTAVSNLDLRIPAGSVYGFIGPNGSGKTTTLRMIVNIFRPDEGEIRVFHKSAAELCSGSVGYLPEERGLHRGMKVRSLLEFHAELRGGRPNKAEVNRWLEKFGLAKFSGQKLETFSKGMSQKVQFIAAVVPTPRLLILDEPFTGLDPVSAEMIRTAVLELRQQGVTIILSTHDMNVAEKLCDSIFMIYRSKKVLDGTLESIQQAYGNNTIRVATTAGVGAVDGLPGVEACRDLGRMQELRLALGSDPQLVLRALLARTAVTHFEVAKPSLHDIFVRIAMPEEQHAA